MSDTKPITMQDVRLYAGEGKLSAHDVLNAVNAVLRNRSPVGRPQIWTAETIKDAPDVGEIGYWLETENTGKYGPDFLWAEETVSLARCKQGFNEGWVRRAYGPIPQPPQQQGVIE